ncbi:MAG: carbon storage regulator [Phycisphaeraceae bacterium]|nr:carbon storage regulator [Phycisphaeraceae bacterium]
MLILTLHPDQTAYLKDVSPSGGGKVIGEVTIVQVRGNKVRLGFECPSSIHIDRHPHHDTRPVGKLNRRDAENAEEAAA